MLNDKPDNSISISWEITPNEQKERKLEVLFYVIKRLPFLLGALFVYLLSERHFSFAETLNSFFYILLFVVLMVGIYYICLLYITHEEVRRYFLDNEKIKISKGGKEKTYFWSDFECFYLYEIIRNDSKNQKFSGSRSLSKENRGKIIEILQEEQKISGQVFHLKKKAKNILGKIYKTFVVIQSESDNLKEVDNFLNNHLLKQKMAHTTDLGLVFYEFR
ncbi:hypothetical protein KKB43_01805 [Patescibacteria group bacterium]|nr:hypothetical protein [Patescibacteria group bacterium]MBU4579729.1 hypothetical protein [Patescibacteria group bacterium]